MADGYMPQAVGPRTRRAIAQRGLRPVVGDYARWGTGLLAGLPWVPAGEHGRFTHAGEDHRYRYVPYKFSWLTERAIEVPIAQALVDRYADRRVLEVGNVLSHFGPQQHTIVDKYEQAPGVLNRDVFDLAPLGMFDLVVAISTLEHVGWDEEPRRPALAAEAIAALRERLSPGGELLITFPVGYHPHLEVALRERPPGLASLSAMRRVSRTRWREADPAEVWGLPYDFLLYSARAVVFATLTRD